MAEITLAKRGAPPLDDAQRTLIRSFLFDAIDGVDEANRKAWRRFWNFVLAAELGQVFSVETWFPRNGRFHRLHMAMEQAVFESQERFTQFAAFRDWLKIGAGFVDWVPGPRGGVIPIPRSISYRALDEEGMRAFHEATLVFLREPRPQKVLWPRLAERARADMVESLLTGFES
jgi:hypothetical protein